MSSPSSAGSMRAASTTSAARAREEGARGAPQRVVESADIESVQDFCEQRLGRAATTPCLPHDTTMRNGDVAGIEGRFEAAPHRTVVPLERDERSAVEHERQADLPRRVLRLPALLTPRTTTADSRSARA
jgi:hypothetical protein